MLQKANLINFFWFILAFIIGLCLTSCQLGKRRLLLEQLSKPPPLIPITIKFTDVTDAAGVNYQQHSLKQEVNIQARMAGGAAAGDYDNDGDLDLFVVNYIDWSLSIERECRVRGVPTYCSPNTYGAPAQDRLYENKGDGTFVDVTEKSGVSRSYGRRAMGKLGVTTIERLWLRHQWRLFDHGHHDSAGTDPVSGL